MYNYLNPSFSIGNINNNLLNKKIIRKKIVRPDEEEIYTIEINKQIINFVANNFEENIEKKYTNQNSYNGAQNNRNKTFKKTKQTKSSIKKHLKKFINFANYIETNILNKTKKNSLDCLA